MKQQKIVIRTNGPISSSGVVLNNKIYFGSWDHNVYEYYEKINLNKTIKNINLNSLILQKTLDAIKKSSIW